MFNHVYIDYVKAKKQMKALDERILKSKEALRIIYDKDDSPLSDITFTFEDVKSDFNYLIKARYRASMKAFINKPEADIT
jgi:hypothetical protein